MSPLFYTERAQEFRTHLLQDGATPEQIDRLLKLADRWQLLALIFCNVNVGDKFEQERAELRDEFIKLCTGPVKKVRLDGDPRGFTVKLFLTSGRYNSWGGREDGYGVPTREHSAELADRAAHMPAKHWTPA